MKHTLLSFRERIRRVEVIADRIDSIADGATAAPAGLRADSAFLRQEAVRMTDILARFAKRDADRKALRRR